MAGDTLNISFDPGLLGMVTEQNLFPELPDSTPHIEEE